MKLKDIEDIVLSNFIFSKSGNHRLSTDAKIEKSTDTAIIVFCALARFVGYSGKEIISFLEINKQKYDFYIARFLQAYNLYRDAEIKDLYEEQSLDKKIASKVKFLSKSLNIGFPKDQYIDLSYFGY